MASISNRERITRALDQLSSGLRPYVAREMEAVYGRDWQDQARQSLPGAGAGKGGINWDSAALLGVMWSEWNSVFKTSLGHAERSLVSELRDARNRWAHEEQFSNDDVYRALDSMHRLLTAVAALEATELDRQKQEVLRVRFEEQAKREKKRAAVAALEGAPTAGLLPWREVVTPHADVAGGHYQQAEFAADLGQVHRGEGSTEYRDPRAFYQRTFLTEGLRHLLVGALRRLSGQGGDPVVKLQTNFGGGKTHSMLALYHLVSGTPAADLAGIDPVLAAASVSQPPTARRAVLVGTALSPGQPGRKPDGTVVNTLWGELAWQLGGAEGYALVAESDRAGTNPGEALRTLFQRHAPCLILIDEWVAFVRQLYGKANLPAGDFEANLTFAQWLTEAAKAVQGVLVVASLPASDIEIGGEGGREALRRLEHTFARVESTWRPASAEEGFEIVRRRLFEPITDPEKFRARDTVVQAFIDYYRQHRGEFPPEVAEADYARRLTAAYPIHPELFDRLYNDWSALENFQRTRGVLRLMAAVIHALWSRNDRSLLILPASVPIDDAATHFELTRYVEDAWVPIIEQDVDGPHSIPLRIDQDNPNLGRYSATRRVARTLYLGSAPTVHATHKGLEDRRVKLGAAQPGESVHTFGDALRRLADRANHIYQNGSRYWYALQPSVNRLAEERAAQQRTDDVHLEIIARLKADMRQRGDFPAVHVAPAASGDVPDDRDVRLIVLDPLHPHSRGTDSAAKAFASDVLENRGTGPRRYRNQVVFLAPDATRLAELEQAARQFLAWSSILYEKKALNLDNQQTELATAKRSQADEAIRQRIPETYIWLLVPGLPSPQASAQELEWQEIRLQGAEALAVRASRKLRNDGLLNTQYAGSLLRMELDRIPLWRGDHVLVRDLADFFAQYLYLPRLRSSDVLLSAIQDGVNSIAWESDGFGYADGFDAERERYRGLKHNELITAVLNGESVVVKPGVVRAQLDRERPASHPAPAPALGSPGAPAVYPPPPAGYGTLPVREQPAPYGALASRPKRFYGAVALNPERLTRDMGSVAQEVIAHLLGLVGAESEITLDIQVRVPEGVPQEVVRTVLENARTLRFTAASFEPE
jgi:predicted AAA+ superfamily ATPase